MINIITLDGEKIDLGPNSSITIDELNPFFVDDSIPAPFVFSFDIPKTLNNTKVLGFPNEVNNKKIFRETVKKVRLTISNVLVYTCNLKVISVGSSIKIKLDSIPVDYADIKDRSIKSFRYGGNRDMGANILTFMDSLKGGGVPTDDFVFAPLKNLGLTSGNVTGYLNPYDVNANAFYCPVGQEADHSLCPFIYLGYIFRYLMEEAELTFDSAFLNDPEILGIVYYNAAIKPFTYNLLFQRGIKISNHIPEQTVSDFFNDVKRFFRLGFFFDLQKPNHLKIKPFQEVYESNEYVDLSTFFNEYELIFNEYSPNGYTLIQKRDENDLEPYDLDDYRYIYEDGKNEVELGFDYPNSDQQLVNMISAPNWVWRIPIVNQEIDEIEYLLTAPNPNLEFYKVASFGKRLMFYRGMQNASAGQYPYLSTDDLDYAGATAFNYSLHWSGNNGLWEKLHKNYYQTLYKTKVLRINKLFPAQIVAQLFLDKKVKIRGNKYIIRRKKTTYTNTSTGLYSVDLELIKL